MATREDLSAEVREHVAPDEEVVWTGCPQPAAFLGTYFLIWIFVWVALVALVLGAVLSVIAGPSLASLAGVDGTVGGLAVWSSIQVVYWIGVSLVTYRLYRDTEYVATDRQAIQCRGNLTTGLVTVEWDDVEQVGIRRSFSGRRAGSGTVHVDTTPATHGLGGSGTRGVRFAELPDPESAVATFDHLRAE